MGLREVELNNYSNLQENLVIGLGDSFTEGKGAPLDSVWLKQMEHILEGRLSIKTLNAGVNGSDPLFEYMLFKYKLSQYEPKLVIVAINGSDINDIITRGGFERFNDNFSLNYKEPEWWEYFYSFSFIVRNIVHEILNMDWQFLTDDEKEQEVINAQDAIFACIKKFYEYSVQKNFKLLVIFHPYGL